jgi:hypothetical protein
MPENKPIAPNREIHRAEYGFNGKWVGASGYDPIEAGPSNFKTQQNMRHGGDHLEGISGYTVLNETPISTYTDIKTGIQLRTNRDNPSHVIVAAANSGGTAVELFESTDDITDAITLTSIKTGRASGAVGSAFSDSTGNTPRIGKIPQHQIVYSNEEASYIYGGNQADCAACFLCDGALLGNPRDYWKTVRNSLSTDTMPVAAASTDVFTVHSIRPLQGVWFTVTTPNATASTLSCSVWTSAGFAAVTNASDGTTSGGVALAQSGEFVFDYTGTTAQRAHLEGTFFYVYRFTLSAGSASISQIQVDAPFQTLVDAWDGVPRNAIYAGINFSGGDEDFTAHVIESSTETVPIGMILDGLTATDEIYLVFEDRTAALNVTMLSTLVNAASGTITVKYWNGAAWAAVSNLVDFSVFFSQSGIIAWTPPAESAEFQTTIGGVTGYAYEISISATITGTHGDTTDSVVLDVLTSVPADLEVPPYKFHSEFKGRHFGCGAVSEKEGNRIDFTAPYAPDVWNGFSSSYKTYQSLYLGTDEDLTCGAPLYNRYGSVDRLFEVWVGFSDSHTFQVKESSLEDTIYDYDLVSSSIGCPAPETLTQANIGMESGVPGAKRNVLLWVDSSGPYSYDGSSLDPIPGLEKYFDPNDDLYVGEDLSDAHGWFDPIYKEWNLRLPGDIWVCYILEKKRWFQKDTGDAETPTCGFQVVDSDGSKYAYGGLATGEIARLEYGTTWDGENIVQKVYPCDFFPTGSVWDKTRIKRIKLLAIGISESHAIEVTHMVDTQTAAFSAYEFHSDDFDFYSDVFEWMSGSSNTMSLTPTGNERVVRVTIRENVLGWCHGYGFTVSTDDTAKGFQPIKYAIEYEVERPDY